MKTNLLFLLAILIFVFSCSKDEIPDYQISKDARYYMDFAFDLMQENSIRKNEIDWDSFRDKYLKMAGNAQTYEDTYTVLNQALKEIHKHSFFQSPSSYNSSQSQDDSDIPWPEAWIEQEVGFLKLPYFSGNSDQSSKYAQMIQDSIRSFDSKNVKAWIVDLRGNTGGNMFPMVAGLGPLFDNEILGYFIRPGDFETPWDYINGSSTAGSNVRCTVSQPYSLLSGNPKIAVLQNDHTASSGEATLISFIGNNNTKTFGTPSAGYSTANSGFIMPDDARLLLTTSYMADRNKTLYGEEVNPEVSCSSDEAPNKALEWIFNSDPN